jgi:DNA-binding CsgD family transcriptional regulator
MASLLTEGQVRRWARLTGRQRRCIEAMRTGHCTTSQIAEALGIDADTVRECLIEARILLRVRNRIELALVAERIHTRERSLGKTTGFRA